MDLGETEQTLAARIQGELVVCGLHDARRASRVAPALERLSSLGAGGGLIAVDAAGGICMRHNSETMLHAWVREGEAPGAAIS